MYNRTAAPDVYLKNQVLTATPKQLVTLLYEGIIKNLRQAELFLEMQDFGQVNDKLVKAQDIIWELRRTLDFEQGGEIAPSLDNMYDFLIRQLIEANVHKNVKNIRSSISLVQELKETWEQI